MTSRRFVTPLLVFAVLGCTARSRGDGHWQDARAGARCPADQVCMESPSGVVLGPNDPRPCQCAAPLRCSSGGPTCTVNAGVLECRCSDAPPPP